MTIYVGNLSYRATAEDLTEVFAEYGTVKRIALPTDRETGRSKGFAFITFATQSAAESALEQNGKDMKGRALRVNVAQDKVKTGGGGGGPRNDRPRW